jgi:hypothetical protein
LQRHLSPSAFLLTFVAPIGALRIIAFGDFPAGVDMRRSGALYQVINRKERRRAEARLGNQGRSQAAQQRQLCSGSARDNVGAREQGSDRGSHEILLVLGRQTTWAVDHILSTPGLSDNDRIAILGGTAVGLLGIKSSKGRDPQPARQNFRHPDRGSQVRSRPDGGGSRALRIAFRSHHHAF